jgi:hypothetical protein
MKQLIWEVPFWCETCNKDIMGRVYHEESDKPLSEEEKARGLELLKHYHQIGNHTTCWQCSKNIKPDEIAAVAWVNSMWKDLCNDCAYNSNWPY